MEEEEILINGIITDYFNSVKESFDYKIKNEWKTSFFGLPLAFAVFYFLLNVIPVLPALSDNYLLTTFEKIKSYVWLENQTHNFWTEWLIGTLLSLIIVGLLFIPFMYVMKKENKHFIGPQLMIFCYAYILRRNIKNYIISNNTSHLEKCDKYYKKIIVSLSSVLVPNLSEKDKYAKVSFVGFKNELNKGNEYIKFTKKSNEFIDAISEADKKIRNRIIKRIDLNNILPFLDYLTIIEFSKAKPNSTDNNGIKLSDKKNDYIKKMVESLNKINPLEDKKKSIKINLRSIKSKIVNGFYSTNIFVLFFCWLTFLSIIFILGTLVLKQYLEIKMDSTLTAALITVPFAGAIAITSAIYTKK